MSKNKKTNIIVLFSDQQRWDTLGCYGQKLNITPNLDQMASEGVKFENTFTAQPLCGPVRSSLQTGKYPTRTGCFRNGIALPLDEKTIAHHLSDCGYEVGYIGKWHLASTHGLGPMDVDYTDKPIPPERRGGYKDYWLASDLLEFTSHGYDGHIFDADMQKISFPKGRYRADCLTDWVIDYLGSHNKTKPFFLFASYVEPHHQNDRNCYEGPVGSKELFKNFEAPGDLINLEGDWQEQFPDYLGCVNSLDKNLGRIRDEIDKLGLRENTLIVYTSDHGSHFRTRNSEYKRSCHEGSIRIPLIIYGPGFSGGKTPHELVSLLDLPPTLLAEAGVEIPKSMYGQPLQNIMQGNVDDWPKEVFIQISGSQVGRAIRTKRWKYAVYAPDKQGGLDPGSEKYVEQFLYDLERDPFEQDNLVSSPEYSQVRKCLAKSLIQKMLQAGESPPLIFPATDS